MSGLLKEVKSKLFIFAHRRTLGLLDGEYGSVFKGRSLDFDELRAYVAGDDIRDIDWKATARHGSPLIKRYVAPRRQTVLLVTDTGRNMAAASEQGDPKCLVAVEALGLLGYLAVRHGDDVGMVHGHALHNGYLPPRPGEQHLERILRAVHDSTSPQAGPSKLAAQLRFVLKHFRRRMLIMVVADQFLPDAETQSMLRRLAVRHELLWFTIRDASLVPGPESDGGQNRTQMRRRTVDVSDNIELPGVPARGAAVRREYAHTMETRERLRREVFQLLGIAEVTSGGTREVLSALFTLLARHRIQGSSARARRTQGGRYAG